MYNLFFFTHLSIFITHFDCESQTRFRVLKRHGPNLTQRTPIVKHLPISWLEVNVDGDAANVPVDFDDAASEAASNDGWCAPPRNLPVAAAADTRWCGWRNGAVMPRKYTTVHQSHKAMLIKQRTHTHKAPRIQSKQ